MQLKWNGEGDVRSNIIAEFELHESISEFRMNANLKIEKLGCYSRSSGMYVNSELFLWINVNMSDL